MKWIKASERLPKDDGNRPVKVNGQYAYGNFFDLDEEKRAFSVNSSCDGYIVYPEYFDKLEWLDESIDANMKPSPNTTDGIKIDHNKSKYGIAFFDQQGKISDVILQKERLPNKPETKLAKEWRMLYEEMFDEWEYAKNRYEAAEKIVAISGVVDCAGYEQWQKLVKQEDHE